MYLGYFSKLHLEVICNCICVQFKNMHHHNDIVYKGDTSDLHQCWIICVSFNITYTVCSATWYMKSETIVGNAFFHPNFISTNPHNVRNWLCLPVKYTALKPWTILHVWRIYFITTMMARHTDIMVSSISSVPPLTDYCMTYQHTRSVVWKGC